MPPSSSVKAIFWDNDGILVDTEGLYFRATQQVLAEADIALSRASYVRLFLVEGTGTWELIRRHGGSREDYRRITARRNRLYGEWLAVEPLLMEGITEVLADLHGHYRMAVVTTSTRDHFDLMHGRTGLLSYFDFVLASGDYPRAKPAPDPYLAAVARSGLAPEHCLAIEDSERGLTAAKAAGLRCIAIPTSLSRAGSFAAADRVLPRLADIPAAVRELAAITAPSQ